MIQRAQLEELILQSLEHERRGVQVYEAAVNCAKTAIGAARAKQTSERAR